MKLIYCTFTFTKQKSFFFAFFLHTDPSLTGPEELGGFGSVFHAYFRVQVCN